MKIAKFLPLALILLILGCSNPFRPNLMAEGSQMPQNKSPEKLLKNLERSYQEKNINIFSSLLHEDYRFELLSSEYSQIGVDMDGDGIRDTWWDYEQELEMTRNMFERGSSDGSMPVADDIELRLQIPPQELWEIDPAVGHENWIVIPCYFDLILSYTHANSYYVANGIARFYLVEEKGFWKIIIWRDESNI